MRFVGVIPARYGSTRLPAKPLIKIHGKPLLQWVVEAAQKSPNLSDIIVATDHEEIIHLAESFGVKAVTTSPDIQSGTDRVYAAVKDLEADVVFNIQGDEPLLNPSWIDSLIQEFKNDPQLKMATVATKLDPKDLKEPSVVKVVMDSKSFGIYFSRYAIPYSRVQIEEKPGLCMQHIGLYAFTKSFLKDFCDHGPTDFERAESLEQLRAYYMGERIKVLPIEGKSIGIDTPEDLIKIEEILKGV